MSLEAALDRNTTAINALLKALIPHVGALGALQGAAVLPTAEVPADVKPEPKAEPKAEAPKAEAPKAEAPKAEAPKAEAPALADVQKVVLKLASTNRSKAVEILTAHGAAKASELKPEHYAPVFAAVNAALAA